MRQNVIILVYKKQNLTFAALPRASIIQICDHFCSHTCRTGRMRRLHNRSRGGAHTRSRGRSRSHDAAPCRSPPARTTTLPAPAAVSTEDPYLAPICYIMPTARNIAAIRKLNIHAMAH